MATDCDHCYCLDVRPSEQRPKPHQRCCKCGDITMKYGARNMWEKP